MEEAKKEVETKHRYNIHFNLRSIAEFMKCHPDTVTNRMNIHKLTLKKLQDLETFYRFLNDYVGFSLNDHA